MISLFVPLLPRKREITYYKQNIDGSGFFLAETENMTGITDAAATAIPKAYTGFTENTAHADRATSGIITANGGLTLKLYYDRNTYNVSYETNGGSVVEDVYGVRYEL